MRAPGSKDENVSHRQEAAMAGGKSIVAGRAMAGVWRAVRQLNPKNVRAEAGRGVRVAVIGELETLQETARFLLGEETENYESAGDALVLLSTPLDSAAFGLLPRCDVIVCFRDQREKFPGVADERVFDLESTADLPAVTDRIVQEASLAYARLPLARSFPGFRRATAREIVQTTSIENAVFVASTSLGNVIPNPLQPLASVAEALGDTVVLTANQVRMLFRLGAALNRQIGVRQQMPEVFTILGAAVGWRSVARELVSKMPFGSGVVPKAGIAFAGTWAIGDAVAYYYTTGRQLSREEIRQRFDAAQEMGRTAVEAIVARLRESFQRGDARPGAETSKDREPTP